MQTEFFASFDQTAHATWGALFQGTARSRADQAHPLFVRGLEKLGMDGRGIPDLATLNGRLMALTGWQMVPVEGLEGPREFFRELHEQKFPVGNFIRSAQDLAYTPAPDVFHDVYGHIPFIADRDYAAFCQEFGTRALPYLDAPELLRQFERLFWFGVEFPLIETALGRRIFGGGILSSSKECDYCLSPQPEVRPFDVEAIRSQEYRIDQIQPLLFSLASPEQLYGSLEGFDPARRA